MAVAASLVAMTGCERTPDGKPIAARRVLGEVGISPGQYAFPRCLDTDGRSLWVVDKLARVQRVDLKTGKGLSGWKMPDSDLGKPTGITVFDPTGRDEDQLVFVADTHYHRVLVYRPGPQGSRENAPAASFGTYGRGDGQFIYTTDIAVLPDGKGGIERVYVSEYGGNDRISIWEPTPDAAGGTMQFRFARSFGVYGDEAAAGQVAFRRPQALEIDHVRQRLVVADACNHRIGLFTLEGAPIKWIGAAKDGSQVAAGQNVESPFRYPYGLTLLDDGTALVAEFGAARVSRDLRQTGPRRWRTDHALVGGGDRRRCVRARFRKQPDHGVCSASAEDGSRWCRGGGGEDAPARSCGSGRVRIQTQAG
jgi:hypothetical protein